ncbi:MAG TPA: OsmC family protein [Candidatus Kapabacteria bacterium]|nr:OsmC family protein [Candidatus Kapabacteria bacterium]
MDAQSLRSLQAPLKEQYKLHPEAALVTLHAEATLGENVTAKLETHSGVVVAGLHPATGGSGKEACSGDMLLDALAACAAVTMNAVATAIEIPFRSASVKASGELDFRGTLGVGKEAPVGFKSIHIEFVIDTDAPDEKVESLIRLTERYCVVFQTLRVTPVLTASRK